MSLIFRGRKSVSSHPHLPMPSQLEQTPHIALNINRGDAESEETT